MSKGITLDCVVLWRHVANDRGWWSVLRLTRAWSPSFSLDEVAEHLVTLKKGGFLEAQNHPSAGTVYGFTARCRTLPGEAEPAAPSVAPAARRDAISTTYQPLRPTYREGAFDHTKCPSLQLGKRMPYHSPVQ